MAVDFTDNTADVLEQIRVNKLNALAGMGREAVALTVSRMQTGYWKAIYLTGALQADVQYAVENSRPDSVDVGNTLHYATYVHFGTVKMRARPYLSDALANGKESLQRIAEWYMKQGF